MKHFRPRLSRRAFWVLCALLVCLRLALTGFQQAYIWVGGAPLDDELMFRAANHITAGQWLGAYDYLTLSKAMFFPVWLALLHVLHLPYLVSGAALWCAASLLAAFAFVSYYGSLLLVDAWAPWQPLTGVNAARNFAAILIPACGYGVSFLGAEEHVRAEEMRKKASMDPLTGLRNRRAMLNDIQEMLETLSEPLWLVCLDLDNFKWINDQYGHDIGDQYLRRFGTMLEEMTEQNGQAYRTGGDEFAVLYSGGSAEKIEALRECCLQSFRDGEKPEFLGVSIGYEQVQDFESLAEVMKRADEMMYVEKRAKQYARGCAAEDTKEVLIK